MMASEKQKQQQFRLLHRKIRLLEEEKENFYHVFDIFVNNIVKPAKTWTEDRSEDQPDFSGLCQLLDCATMFISQKSVEMVELDSEETCSLKTKLLVSFEKSGSSLTSLLSCTPESVAGHELKTPLWQQDSVLSPQIVSRIEQAEKSIMTLRASSEKIPQIENSLDKLSSKWLAMDVNMEVIMGKQREADERAEEILLKQNEISEQLSSLTKAQTDDGKKVKKLSVKLKEATDKIDRVLSTIGEMEERIEEICTEQKGTEEKIENLESEINEFSDKMEEVADKQHDADEKIEGLLSRSYDSMTRLESMSCKLSGNEKKYKEVSDMLDEINKRCENLRAKHSEIEETMGDISQLFLAVPTGDENSRPVSLVEAILGLTKAHTRKENMLEKKLVTVKRKGKSQMQQVSERYDKVEIQYKMVCQIVADRLLALERLRDILNKKIECRNENIKKLQDLEKAVTGLSDDMKRLSNTAAQKIGFAAYFPTQYHVQANAVLTYFTDIKCNLGGHFNPTTGEFVAPRDGLYFVSLTLWQWEEGKIDVDILLKVSSNAAETSVCLAGTGKPHTSGTAVGVVDLKAGETLFARVSYLDSSPKLSHGTSFSCYLVC